MLQQLSDGGVDLYRCAVRTLVYLGRNPRTGLTYSKFAHHARTITANVDSDWFRHVAEGAVPVDAEHKRGATVAMMRGILLEDVRWPSTAVKAVHIRGELMPQASAAATPREEPGLSHLPSRQSPVKGGKPCFPSLVDGENGKSAVTGSENWSRTGTAIAAKEQRWAMLDPSGQMRI